MTTTQDGPEDGLEDGAHETDGGTGGVVVAYDGSEGARAALTWAAREAASRGSRLRVLYAADIDDVHFISHGSLAGEAREKGERFTREGAELAQEAAGPDAGLVVDGEVHLTSPTAALVEASHGAEVVVVGNRGRGPVAGALLGSVAFSVTARAACPVVVVRGMNPPRVGPGGPVVVGVDDSRGARAAVDVAARAAARADAHLVVLAAWQPSDSLAAGGGGGSGAYIADATVRARASVQRLLDAAVARVDEVAPGLAMDVRSVQQRPSAALAAASAGAGLVVVGARGHGSVGGLFLGSVSHSTIHRASCPVLVVRTDQGL